MDQLTFKQFKKNTTYILAVGEIQKAIRKNWLKRHEYTHLNGYSIDDELKCYGGGCSTVLELNNHYHSPDVQIYSVYQLKDWDKPQVKEMTVAEISKLVGCEVKIIK